MTSNAYRLLILPGDGIGREVMGEVRRVAEWFRDRRKLPIELSERPFGLDSWNKFGSLMPDETAAEIEACDAVLFGAMDSLDQAGKITAAERKKGSLPTLRKTLDVFNLRPIKAIPALLDVSTLKREVVDGVDLVFVRELTGGVYFGEPRGVTALPDAASAASTRISTRRTRSSGSCASPSSWRASAAPTASPATSTRSTRAM